MTEKHSFLSATLGELTRRKVLSTMGAYAVAVFVVLQLMDAGVEPLRLPDWLPTLVVIALILGFPVVFLLAGQFELTAAGIKKASPAGLLSRRQSVALFGSMLMVTFGLGCGFYIYYSGLFAVETPTTVIDQAAAARQFSAPAKSIAVLPFTDLSANGDQAYFSDGVAEEILNLLAQVKGLHVAARTSSFAFRDEQHNIREIGQLLNVRTVLEGSIRTSGNRIRLTVQLINVEDGYHIWSKSFDREIDDLFAIQDEIASDIAAALGDSFAGLMKPSGGNTDSLAAANAYHAGRLHWWRRTTAELQQARLNGVNDADIFYSEAGLKALQGQYQEAVAKLQQAYDRGFREDWMLTMDWRLAPLRGQVKFVEHKSRIGHDIERSKAEIRSTSMAML
ncbi:MAG: hypothetical protein SH820_02985 [Xanthomonadales bacterium]|nr:hypothetical protein [Xanthomonadales bacterium]